MLYSRGNSQSHVRVDRDQELQRTVGFGKWSNGRPDNPFICSFSLLDDKCLPGTAYLNVQGGTDGRFFQISAADFNLFVADFAAYLDAD